MSLGIRDLDAAKIQQVFDLVEDAARHIAEALHADIFRRTRRCGAAAAPSQPALDAPITVTFETCARGASMAIILGFGIELNSVAEASV